MGVAMRNILWKTLLALVLGLLAGWLIAKVLTPTTIRSDSRKAP
jgi:NhaP-type Na+/H+ or K+/H+ antiporter